MADNPTIKLISIGGLDLDSDPSKIANTDYLIAYNMRNSNSYGNQQEGPWNMNGNDLVAYTLGNATYQCLGSLEDLQNSIFYFVWASDGKHRILRYYPGNVSVNPLGEIQLVYEYNFGWSQYERITGIDFVNEQLLYWVDSVKPRKVDVVKGNTTNKFKTWDITMPINASGTYGFSVEAINLNTGVVTTQNLTITGATREILLQQLAIAINTHQLQNIFNAEACSCSMTLTEKVANTYNVIVTLPEVKVVPMNWYGLNLIDRFSDACKYPNQYPPLVTYIQDATKNFNFVKGHVFQFRTEYIFDNYEQSVLSPISNIAVNNLNCDGTNNVLFNAIQIDFNDALLLDPNTWVLVKKVNVMVRELNSGDWLQINQLDYCDFIYQVGFNLVCKCNFYNNELPLSVPQVLSSQNFDNLPIKANAQKFASNQIAYGGITENYTGPDCVEADYRITMGPTPDKKLYKVTFKIRVLSIPLFPGPTGNTENLPSLYPFFNTSPFWNPSDNNLNYTIQRGIIGHDTSRNTPYQQFYGGGGFSGNNANDFGIRFGMETTWDQRIPMGGWPIYLAGTPFYGISRQVNTNLPIDGTGALDTSTAAFRQAIGAYLLSGGDVYSEVTLLVPEGEYIARAASHWCGINDPLGKGFIYDLNGTAWQKTSATVWGVYAPGSGDKPMFTANSWQFTKEIKIVVTGDMPDAGTFLIADLAPPFFVDPTPGTGTTTWMPINAYLYDSNNNGAVDTDVNDIQFNGIPVEKTIIEYVGTTAPDGTFDPADAIFNSCTTDANGYWFGISPKQPINNAVPPFDSQNAVGLAGQFSFRALQINSNIISNTTLFWNGSLSTMITKTMSPIDFNLAVSNSLVFGVLTTTNGTGRTSCAATIKGSVFNLLNQPLPGIAVIYQNGAIGYTNTNGAFELLAWGDQVTPNINIFKLLNRAFASGTGRTVDVLLYQANPLCITAYPNGHESIALDVNPINTNPSLLEGPPYSETAFFLALDFTIDESALGTIISRKRGGKYIDGVAYYDAAGRETSVSKMYEIYIPFETEDLSLFPKVVQGNGLPYPLGSYVGGIPTIEWFITSAPPEFAVNYQILRTLNSAQGRYLQWAVNSVQYLSKTSYISGAVNEPQINTSYGNDDAVAIDLSLENISEYNRVYPQSDIAYSPMKGDRLRLIYDSNVKLIDGLYDFEVLGANQAGTGIIIASQLIPFEIKPGFLVEIYNAKSLLTTTQQIFYETGNVFPCTNPGQPNNAHSQTSGFFSDGDTYWRGRLIVVDDPISGFAAALPLVVEDASVSDFYSSLAEDIGRLNKIDPFLIQIYKYTAIRVSNSFVPDSQINGLSAFQNVDDVQLDLAFGPIMRLIATGFVLGAVCQNKFVSNYLGATQGAKPDGTLQIASQQGFVGDSRPLLGDYGTQHPATVIEKDGHGWGADFQRGVVWEYSDNGLEELQKLKVRNFFRQFMISGVWDALAGYDAFYGEYILTAWVNYNAPAIFFLRNGTVFGFHVTDSTVYAVGQIVRITFVDVATQQTITLSRPIQTISQSNIYFQFGTDQYSIAGGATVSFVSQGQGYTIAFQKDKRRWTTFYNFYQDSMCGVGMNFVTWKSGQLYLHDRGQINTFNGVYYPWLLNVVATQFQLQSQPIKVWTAMYIQQLEGATDSLFNWSIPVITNEKGQLSRLLKTLFQRLEQWWHTSMKKDLNTTSVTNPIVNGREMRSQTLTLNMINDSTNRVELREVNVVYQDSVGNTK